MRIGVNGRFLIAKRTGVQRAAYNLLRTLVQLDRENEYLIFTGESQLNNPDWQFPNVKVITSAIREGENIRNHFWEQFTLPRMAKQHHVDILHSPANLAPLFYKGKSIIHIHDLCFAVNPQWYSFQFRTLYNFIVPRLARRATKVITNSNNSRNDLLQYCDVPAEKVSLVYWAVDEMFNRVSEQVTVKPRLEKEQFILYVGSLDPRKNIRTLVQAYQLLRERDPQSKVKLILIGGEHPIFSDVRLNITRFKQDIVSKGFVDDDLLRQYYKEAALVVFPSLYEGFGLPPLEAMASGVPVVTSKTSSIPEVVGDAAVMVDPLDANQLANAMSSVLKDEQLRKKLIDEGFEQVKRFNWYRVARNTLAVYYEVYHMQVDDSEHNAGPRYLPFDVWQRLTQLEQRHMS